MRLREEGRVLIDWIEYGPNKHGEIYNTYIHRTRTFDLDCSSNVDVSFFFLVLFVSYSVVLFICGVIFF